MSDATTFDERPTRQALAIPGRSGRLKVTGKLRVALDLMVFNGLPRKEAAAQAGLTDHSLRSALLKPHVKSYFGQQLEVLRTGERPRNILALIEVRDQQVNQMARVQAVKALEQLEDQQVSRGAQQVTPGVVIIFEQPAVMAHDGRSEAKPLIEHDMGSDE